MPIYEYDCPDCGKNFEQLVKMSDPIPPCPTCGSVATKKKVTAAGFVLKGGGWYKDGYSQPKPASEGKSDTAAKPNAASPAQIAAATPTVKPSSGGSST